MKLEEKEILRKKRVLEYAEACGNVLETCRHFGVPIKLDVDLDMMTRDLFLVSLGMNGPRSGFARKTAQAVAPQNAIDAGV